MKQHSVTAATKEHTPTGLHTSSRIYINNQTNEIRKPQIIHFSVRLERNRWGIWQAWRAKMDTNDLDEET